MARPWASSGSPGELLVLKLGSARSRNGKTAPRFTGSAQQSVKVCILRGFLESDELGLGGCQALHLQQQVIEIAVASTTAQQRFNVSINGFHYAHRYLDFAIVQDSFQMVQQHPR